MGIEYRSVVDHPLDVVFDWHTRPGAMRRLVPPWQPMTVVSETSSLADGRAVLGLPGGLRWVARHDPAEYDPPHRFVDALDSDGPRSWPARVVGQWRHTHEFASAGPGSTTVSDRVDTVVPAAVLRPMFVYRHTQLADDLAAHRDAAAAGLGSLTVAVTGAGGLVGSALTAFLSTGGHRVIRLVRHRATGPQERQWNPSDPDPGLLDGVDAVVHLAGASIAGRFTAEHRNAIRDSRIEPTRALAELASRTRDGGPKVFVAASAVGFYGYDRGDEPLDETSGRGAGFLADVVADWEAATEPAAAAGLRVVNVRTGVVQSGAGGTLRLLRPLFAAGLGGRLGTGAQWLSWIGLDDLLDVYHRALYDERLRGPVNAVAPEPVTNAEYTAALGRVLHRPTLLPVPSFGPRLLLGEQGVRELAEADQRVHPAALLGLGHRFRRPGIEAALAHELGHG
ncbi:NAD-dependent nucleoside-diphosphate sugar epimerase [Mycolicibacterium canariasense]|uniref:NAD-dependent nucleoside-diphosphate sugar epimerase n=1 Tax=Mycolicibacterium canariasense TaxID=228230 RepID=A0A100W7U6_MYCCR|nr:TIGR01777 family oxidoreductase [Mycolicibacterium canariasense]MCV7212250.1 TIGR01777 family protein [Mycolicibacterium canariasense]ORU97356.1 nucleoside-diphosphate sugar epimerase [Mycolicibacterium canariasense]GAS93352.1 NAD-dependent nucleoside-diphosphate sugar epimerase [Mycolicibacterium canariasense]